MLDTLYSWFGISTIPEEAEGEITDEEIVIVEAGKVAASEEKKKTTKIVYSSSDRKPSSKRPEISKGRTKSNVGETIINEDELVASFTNIETDSAIGSGVEDESTDTKEQTRGKKKLQRVESKEHIFGNEEYVIVDFIGDLEVSSNRKSSGAEKLPSPPESAIGMTPPSPQSPDSSLFEHISDDDEKESRGTSSVEQAQPKRKAVYSAGKGLKGLKKQNEEKKEEKQPTKRQVNDSRKTSNNSSETTNSEPVSRSSSTRSISSQRGSDERVLRSSFDKSAKTSSTVLQNKLLFDQQIANQFKRRGSFDSNPSSASVSRKSSQKSINEMPTSGIVAGTRSMFEATSTPTPTKRNSWKVEVQVAPTVEPVLVDKPPASNPTDVKKTKKKKFPFKKKHKKTESNEKKDKETPKQVVLPAESMSSDNTSREQTPDVTNESVDVEKETEHNADLHHKKKGNLFSKIRKRSRKSSSGEFSDTETQKPSEVNPNQKEAIDDVEKAIDSKHTDIEISKSYDSPVQEPPESTESVSKNFEEVDQLTLDLPKSRTNTNNSLPTPDVAPPSPGHASSEITAVLQDIIDRKSSLLEDNGEENGTHKKKKRLKLKKKGGQKKREDATLKISNETESPPVVSEEMKHTADDLKEDTTSQKEEAPTEVLEESAVVPAIVRDHIPVVEEDPTVVIKSDAKVEWPDDIPDDGDHQSEAMEIDTLNEVNANVATNETPKITLSVPQDAEENDDVPELKDVDLDVSDHTDMTDGDSTREDEDDLVLGFNNANVKNESDTVSVSTTGTNPEKKKRRLKLKLPKRKGSKKNKNDKDVSPQKETQVWEYEPTKLEKKNSKKLKRPKSLDFLADVISPTRKTEKGSRPVSVTSEEIDKDSPSKKRTFSSGLFKKKKKPTDPIQIPAERNGDTTVPSPDPSPDDFKIPDVIDGQVPPLVKPENGHATLSTELSINSGNSDNSTGLTVQSETAQND